MNIFSKVWKNTLTYNACNAIYWASIYIKHKIKIREVFYGDGFKVLIKKYLNLDLSKDWLGRLYGVINPNIDVNGHFDPSSIIIEIDGDATNNSEQVKHWMYRQLSMVGQLFSLQGLYEYIDVKLKHVGPINADNYLIVFDIASRQRFTYFLKKALIRTILYLTLVAMLLLYMTI